MKTAVQAVFPIWKTVTIGGQLESTDAALLQLKKAGIRIESWVEDLARKVPLVSEPKTLNLVRIRTGNLGFQGNVYLSDTYAAAARTGLELCPAETALNLWVAEHDLLNGRFDCIQFAMEPIRVGNDPDDLAILVLSLINSTYGFSQLMNGRWLSCHPGFPDYQFEPNIDLIFVQKPR